MKLGILADIHEHVRELRRAIDVLAGLGAERFVVLGDVLETGKRMEETVDLLRQVGAVGVWGNHDIGLCFDPDGRVCERYSAAVLGFMGGLQPRLEVGGCLFTHVEPWLDPHKAEDLWYFDGPPDSPEKLARSFAAVPNRVLVIGHLHRWLLGTPDGLLPWRGGGAGTPGRPDTIPYRRPRRLGRLLRLVRHGDELADPARGGRTWRSGSRTRPCVVTSREPTWPGSQDERSPASRLRLRAGQGGRATPPGRVHGRVPPAPRPGSAGPASAANCRAA